MEKRVAYQVLQQSEPYAQAVQALGARVRWLDSGLCLQRNLPLIGKVTYLPRAPLPDRMDGLTLINAPDAQVDRTCRSAGLAALMTPQTVAVLDLRPDEPARAAAQHGKWRNRLRRAQRSALRLHATAFDPQRDDWFLAHETAQRRVQGYRALGHGFTRAYPRDQTLFIQALHRTTSVAAMLFLRHGTGATYHIGWSGPDGRRLNAHPLILWRAGQILRDQGVTHLELGPLDTRNCPDLSRFKLGSGAIPWQLGHSWLHIPRVSAVLRALRHRGGFTSGLLS